jgi:hypothetical protein
LKRTATGPDTFESVGCLWFNGHCSPICYVCPDKHQRTQPGSNVFTKTAGLCGNGETIDMTESAAKVSVSKLLVSLSNAC